VAIKGKSKSRGTKPVTRGPKPVFVPVKTPLVRRRGLWIGVAVVVAAGSIAGVWYGIAHQMTLDRQEELQGRLASATTEYQAAVDPVLGGLAELGLAQVVPPAGLQPFPDLAGVLDDLEADRRVDGAAETAAGVEAAAADAAAAIEEVDATGIVGDRGFDELYVVYVIDSRDAMARSLELYARVASLASLAAESEGDAREGLLSDARRMLEVADETFAGGYSDYVQAQTIAGVFEPTFTTP
jgi:hypothetical protein